MHMPLFYQSKQAFGLDIGQSSVKIVQIKLGANNPEVEGYGYVEFDPSAIVKGAIVKPEIIIDAIKKILENVLVGKITTNRIVASVPVAYSYTRILSLPNLKKEELEEAVKLEVEQYVPVQIEDLYLAHEQIATKLPPKNHSDKKEKKHIILKKTVDTNPKIPNNLILMVATPKRIVDTYLDVFNQLSFDVSVIEPTMFANFRAVNFFIPSAKPRVVIDFGSHSSDLAIYDKIVRLVSTVETGGSHITEQIMKTLNLNREQANKVKTHYGIAKSRWQVQLANGLQPILSDFANEVQKTMRYYHEHNTQHEVNDIVMVGGGANMPGLSDFLTHLTGVTVENFNPWAKLSLASLQPPYQSETTLYDTAIGLALNQGKNND